MAQGRFVGPVALIREAARLLPALKPILVFESDWRNWIDLVEGHGKLIPMLRWRIPLAALQLLWDRHDGRNPEGEAMNDATIQVVASLYKFNLEKAMWGRTDDLHPLDNPGDEAAAFIELPTVAPWSPQTYAPLPISRQASDRFIYDDQGCVPLFRQWQALMLVELALAGPKTLGGLRRKPLMDNWPELGGGHDEWSEGADLDGFIEHFSALEALSWNAAYKQHALMLAKAEKPDRGLFQGVSHGSISAADFVIQGASYESLMIAEAAVAREALSRHKIDGVHLLAAANWLGCRAVSLRRAGHAEAGQAYANLMREAIELLLSTGLSFVEIQSALADGPALLHQLFPVWLDRARLTLTGWVSALARDFNLYSSLEKLAISEEKVTQFVAWLETKGLFAAHMSVPAIAEYWQRPDRDATVGLTVHVSSLAAWVEHVCNEALGPKWTGANSLAPKLIDCWKSQARSDICREFELRRVPNGTAFPDSVRLVLGHGVSTQAGQMALDARLACLIRNECLHRGLSGLHRSEMHEAAAILLRAAMGIWFTTNPSKP